MKPCPFCDSDNLSPSKLATDPEPPHPPLYQIICGFCGARGPFARSEQDAIRVWNYDAN